MLKKLTALLLCLMLVISISACNDPGKNASINGVKLSKYTIVYNAEDVDYSYRAALYIQKQVKERIGVSLKLKEDGEKQTQHEIVVGQTSRDISARLDAQTKGMEFAILADDAHIALEGDYFIIAAAAYYFVENYITGTACATEVPKETAVHTPIVEEANNIIYLIGDGMGQYHSRMFDYFDAPEDAVSDGEDIFYGYLFPAVGLARTDSLSGTTDSAAAGTALACGYKTENKFIGIDKDQNELQSLTELAASLGKATAVLSTDSSIGATPATFTAHANNRSNSDLIRDSQNKLTRATGTYIAGFLDSLKNTELEKKITDTLAMMEKSDKGFFLMYEEGYIDKHCHNMDISKAFLSLIRFNQAIGLMMEYTFYHPDTFVLITADHETGSVITSSMHGLTCTTDAHSSADVPVFAYGRNSDAFNGVTVENIQIPKTLAKLWGVADFGNADPAFPSLI